MGEPLAIEQRIVEAETRWPGLQFRRKTAQEASSACPFCGQATEDGFLIFSSGSYWCRKCNAKGFIDENDAKPPSPEKLLEMRIAALEQKQAEHDKRLTALERMHQCTDHIRYYNQARDEEMRDFWYEKGVDDRLIDQYKLGVCHHCKTDQPRERMSLTIPVINGGNLVNIRHRLITNDNDRYRPHMAGLGNTLFGADDVYSPDKSSILVIEGEIKRIIVKDRIGGNVVATMGKAGFKRAWVTKFSQFAEVMICLDPDATDRANEMAGWFGDRARVVELTCKPDDFFTIYGGSASEFAEFLKQARKNH